MNANAVMIYSPLWSSDQSHHKYFLWKTKEDVSRKRVRFTPII